MNSKLLCSIVAAGSIVGCSSIGHYLGKPYKDTEYKAGMQTIQGKVYCAYYDSGGEGVAYSDTSPENEGSGKYNPLNGTYLHAFRINEAVDISYTKGGDIDDSKFNFVNPPMNVLYIGWTAPGEWTKYTVKVEKTGKYRVGLMYTSNQGGKISISVNDKDVTGPLDVSSTFREEDSVKMRQSHHWNKIDDIAEIELKKGVQVLTLHTVEKGKMNYMWLDFELVSK
jgi:hypothetical protein